MIPQAAAASLSPSMSYIEYRTFSIQNIPTELLQEIFIRAYPHIRIDTTLSTTSEFTLNIWNATRVCSRWRIIALASPELWSDIRIHADMLSRYDKTCARKVIAMLNTCFERSLTREVSLSIGATEHSKNVSFIRDVVLPILHRNRHRISNVDIQTDIKFFNSSLEQEWSWSSIKSLTLGGWQSLDTVEMQNFASGLSNLSILRILGVKGMEFDVLYWNFPWSQLTTFEWKGYPLHLNAYIDVLKKMPHLEDLKLTTCCVTKFSDIRIQMPCLKSLEIEADARSIGKIVGPLVVPLLRTITIKEYRLSGVDDTLNLEPVEAMMYRSNCAVRSFDVIGFDSENVSQETLRHYARKLMARGT